MYYIINYFKGVAFINPQNFFKNNKRYLKLTICFIIVAIVTIIFYRSSASINLMAFLKEAKNILAPFIYGIGIAYVLNPSLKFIENKILIKSKYINERKTLKRCISIGATYIILFSFLIWLISYLIPEVRNSVQDVSSKIKTLDVNSLELTIKKYIPITDAMSQELFSKINEILAKIINNIPNALNKIVSGTVGIASVILNIILGIVISIYILFDKENIGTFNKKMMYAFSNKTLANNILKFCKDANETFEKFFVGKIIDSAIIGIIFFIGLSIIKPPFAVLLSIIIAVTNIIPFFGPFIGGIPVVLITLVTDITNPLKSVWIAIFILALQQFDGNILGPKILGDSIGVKPLGIIFSIIVAGALFGPAGMFFGVPVFAVIFNLFSSYIEKKYLEKI